MERLDRHWWFEFSFGLAAGKLQNVVCFSLLESWVFGGFFSETLSRFGCTFCRLLILLIIYNTHTNTHISDVVPVLFLVILSS